ncbi:unnamed protein product [Diatraea saccharalis]|uniref:Amine oxidase domain-containing protein n=1 Tax=Diatraea saccharalis TaxID=40085 RepID=A0A9N9R6B6_9NEOP|nr:unnamed protein product [Diatraea saccharalis]
MKYIEEEYSELLKDQEFITAYLEYMDLIIDTYEATTSWNDVSTASKAEELDGDQTLSWHRNGYKTLFEILLNTYNNGTGLQNLKYYLDTEVTRIDWTQGTSKKVVVTCKDGRSFTADNVIVTVSVAVLKDRHASLFVPSLPKRKVDAINNIKMGVEGKIMFSFPTRWWGETNFFEFFWRSKDKESVDLWLTKIPEISHPMGASNVLTLWLTGDNAVMMENLPEDEVRQKAMGLLRRFLGANYTIPEPLAMIRSQWHNNPFTRGSYTYDDVDYPHHPTARADLAEPITDADGVPIVLFAGEATDVTHFATVHGAVDTGHREAMRLLNKA